MEIAAAPGPSGHIANRRFHIHMSGMHVLEFVVFYLLSVLISQGTCNFRNSENHLHQPLHHHDDHDDDVP